MRRVHFCHTLCTLLGLAGCAGESGPTQPSAPTTLVFTVQAITTTAGVALSPAVQVVIQDGAGKTVTSGTRAVTVALGPSPVGGELLGTKTVNAVAGVASFADLAIEVAGSGYTLLASSDGLTEATSAPFGIAAAAKKKLAYVVQPSAAADGQTITPAVRVAVQDAFGNTVTAATDAVTLALAGSGTLSGTLTVAAVQGIATFDNLRIDRPGNGYTLGATASLLAGVTSASFATTLSFVAVSAGMFHSCGVTSAGAAYCWGGNEFGQLGDGTTTDRSSPVRVVGGMSFAAVSAGAYHSCGVTAAGAAYCWGMNLYGQLGDGTTTAIIRSSPILVVGGVTFAAVRVGAYQTCGVTAAGAAYCWGSNFYGQLGDGTTTDRSSPVRVAGGFNFAAVSVGSIHSCGVTAANVAYCWGSNVFGQLGDGTTTDRSSPMRVVGGASFAAASAGTSHTCGLTAAGAAYCWGLNGLGTLGDGTTISRSSPGLVAGNLILVALGTGMFHTCGVTAAGASYCWGANLYGALGDGTMNLRSSPVQVAGGVSLAAVNAGSDHNCGVTAVGAAYCWGRNDHGQLGDGTTIDRLTPVRTKP